MAPWDVRRSNSEASRLIMLGKHLPHHGANRGTNNEADMMGKQRKEWRQEQKPTIVLSRSTLSFSAQMSILDISTSKSIRWCHICQNWSKN